MSWSMRDCLLRSRPDELLPEERARVERAARRYARDPRLSREDRAQIESVWLTADSPESEQMSLTEAKR